MTTVSALLTRYLTHELAKRTGYVWEKDTGRYRAGNGRFVAEADLRALATDFSQYTRDNLKGLTERLLDGRLSLGDWQRLAAGEIKSGYITNMLIGRGGVNAVTAADYGRQGGRLAAEFRYLNQFAKEMAAGELSPAQILARVDQYGIGVQKAYNDGLLAAQEDAGDGWLEWQLGATEKHCADCSRLNGQVHRASRWAEAGIAPQSPDLECGGWHCDCSLTPAEGPEVGDF